MRGLVGLAQMVRASDCGPEGRRFDPDIPPHIDIASPRFLGSFCFRQLFYSSFFSFLVTATAIIAAPATATPAKSKSRCIIITFCYFILAHC